jgi:hypothetical protein
VLKIGIYTSYAKNEVTLSAVQFADWLVRCGVDVELLSRGKIETGIHSVWDHRVRRAHDVEAVCRWAYGATHLCWFEPNSWVAEAAQVVAADHARKRTCNVYFPHWGTWSSEHLAFFANTQRTVCLSQDLSVWLGAKFPDLAPERKWFNLVSPAVPLVSRYGWTDPDVRRLLVVLDRSTVIDIGAGIFSAFESILADHPNLQLTFVFLGSLPQSYRKWVRLLEHRNPLRVTFAGNPSYPDYLQLTRQHDWVYLALTRYRTGSILTHLATTTVPLLCHELPPAGRHVADGLTGRLIPCKLHDLPVPVAELTVRDVRTAIDKLVSRDEAYLKGLQVNLATHLFRKQAMCERFILKEFVS